MKNRKIYWAGYSLLFVGILFSTMLLAYKLDYQKEMIEQFNQAVSLKEEKQYGKAYESFMKLKEEKIHSSLRRKILEELKGLNEVAEQEWQGIKQADNRGDIKATKRYLQKYIETFTYSEEKSKAEKNLEKVVEYEKKESVLKNLKDLQQSSIEKQQKLKDLFDILKEIDKNYEKVKDYLYSSDLLQQHKAMNYMIFSWKMNQRYYTYVQEQLPIITKYCIEENLFTEQEIEELVQTIETGILPLQSLHEILSQQEKRNFERSYSQEKQKLADAFKIYLEKREIVLKDLEEKVKKNEEELKLQKRLQEKIEEELKAMLGGMQTASSGILFR